MPAGRRHTGGRRAHCGAQDESRVGDPAPRLHRPQRSADARHRLRRSDDSRRSRSRRGSRTRRQSLPADGQWRDPRHAADARQACFMTLLVMHPACLAHEMGDGHSERPDRLRAIDRAFESEAFQMLARDIAPRADIAAIARVRPHEYVEALRAATPTRGFTVIDQDTSMSPATFEAALRSAGGAIFAVDEVMTGKATNAFVATRPPGRKPRCRWASASSV